MVLSLGWSVVAVSFASAVLSTPLSTSSTYHRDDPLSVAPLLDEHHPHGTVNNSYIIMFKNGVSQTLAAQHFNFVQDAHKTTPLVGEESGVRHVYTGHFNGYAGRFSQEVIDQVRRMPEVDFVEKDQIVKAIDLDTQKSAPWGLARISHRKKLGFGSFNRYLYDDNGGEGIDVYVIDTGINIHHAEFEGRASWGKTIPQNDVDEDGNGHGTHCAGTIASRKYGVAKKANVIAVKVLGSNGSGTMSDVVNGVEFALNAAQAKAKAAAQANKPHKGSVANMSLGGGKSPSLDRAVNAAVSGGLHFAVAAGNDNRDACAYSPAAAEQAVTVGASTLGDARAYFSNYGECVDIFAPGLNILSTWIGGTTATNTISGTSMASPHIAGLLAYLLSIYPSKTFDPSFSADESLISLTSSRFSDAQSESSALSFYTIAHRVLPSFIASYLPSPKLFGAVLNEDVAPVPKTLTPKQLKKALIALATEGVLSDLPPKTVNLLAFNNATAN